MKKFLVVFLIFMLFGKTGSSQILKKISAATKEISDGTKSASTALYTAKIATRLDSLRNLVHSFNNRQVFECNERGELIKYSPLFVIDGKYLYKLDYLSAPHLKEFSRTYLEDPSIIQSLSYNESASASSLWGSLAENGLVVIYIKKGVQFNPEVAGLKKENRNDPFEDNFEHLPTLNGYARQN